MKKAYLVLLTFTLGAFALTSCSKNEKSEKEARMQVFLTDQPANYGAVNIEVKDVMINYSSDTGSGWVSLGGVKSGTYDILKLVNGNEALLADAAIKSGTISQIRLVLGENNTVNLGGQSFDLKTPSAQQSGLKIKLNQAVNEGISYKLILDFDASRSIVRTGNDKFILKPVIRASVEADGGSIKGYVKPATFPTSVYALRGTDTVAGTITSNGNYQMKAIAAGTYSLSFMPSDTAYKVQSKAGVVVNKNQVTVVDTVTLVK